MTTAPLEIKRQPLNQRPFRGLGVQADAYIFDETNKACGVTEEDQALIARRLRALRPAVARLFVETAWFNPSQDGVTFVWDQPPYRHLVRQLQLLRETATQVNLVLFKPYPRLGSDPAPSVLAMLVALERLITVEGCEHLRWVTLWNEPDTLFFHDSPLYRRIFGESVATTRPPWAEYVRLNRLAHAELLRRGLHPRVKLLVGDTVYGAPMRAERLHLSLAAFGDLDVAYSYHNYNPEDLAFYVGNADFAYAGMAAEAAAFRALLGPDRELMLWEFNTPGLAGFNSHFLGVGPGGVDQVSSLAGAVEVADKVLAGLASGLDGACLWCLHDLVYMGNLHLGAMPCGLWRYKGQKWLPRPLYHYYAALMAVCPPGARLHAVLGCPPGVRGLACETGGAWTVALLNTGARRETVSLPWTGPATRLRVAPEFLPVASDLPLAATAPVRVRAGRLTLKLQPMELTTIRAQLP